MESWMIIVISVSTFVGFSLCLTGLYVYCAEKSLTEGESHAVTHKPNLVSSKDCNCEAPPLKAKEKHKIQIKIDKAKCKPPPAKDVCTATPWCTSTHPDAHILRFKRYLVFR